MTLADVDLYDIDYLDRLANEHPEWGPIEVIDDALYVQPMTSELHQVVLLELAIRVRSVRPKGWRVVIDAYWRASESRMPRPDLAVYRTDRPLARRAVPERPALLVEILSRDREHDLLTKARLYTEADAERYLVIDPEVTEGWWVKDVFADRTIPRDETLTIELPGWPPITVRLEDLLGG